jgi:hypothetical protein
MDREKVIKALEFCTNQKTVDTCYGECPYAIADDEYKCFEMKLDALAVIKEQERRINELKEKLRVLEYGDQDTLRPAT